MRFDRWNCRQRNQSVDRTRLEHGAMLLFSRAEISNATHKKRKLQHRDACADASSHFLAVLNQRQGKEIEAFAESICLTALLCFQCIGELDRLEALRRSFQDLDASWPVKTHYPIWISLFPRQLHINDPPRSSGSEQKRYRLFTRPFLPDQWRQFVKNGGEEAVWLARLMRSTILVIRNFTKSADCARR